MSMTTTRNGFTVQDVTFKNARRQSEIDKEIDHEEVEEQEIQAPVSVTPEQVKEFYKAKIAVAHDSNEKRVYSQTIRWINDLLEAKKKLVVLEDKLSKYEADESTEDTLKDISEDM